MTSFVFQENACDAIDRILNENLLGLDLPVTSTYFVYFARSFKE